MIYQVPIDVPSSRYVFTIEFLTCAYLMKYGIQYLHFHFDSIDMEPKTGGNSISGLPTVSLKQALYM